MPRAIWIFASIAIFFSCSDDPRSSAESENIQITYYEYMDPSMDDYFDLVSYDFMEEQGIEIIRNHYEPTQLRDAFIQEALTGGGPDFAILPSDHLGSISLSNTAIPADQVFDSQYFERFAPQALNHVQVDNTYWGIPLISGNTVILYYNTDMISTPPTTWDELIAMAKEHTSEDSFGLTYNIGSSFFFSPFFLGFGGQMFEPGTNQPDLNSPAMVRALQFVHDLKYTHQILTPRADTSAANRFFGEGKAAFLINGPWAINQFMGKVPFKLTPLPAIGEYTPSPLISSGTIIINSRLLQDPEQLEHVKTLIQYFTEVETQVQIALVAREQPSVLEARVDPRLQENEFVSQFIAQIEKGTPMPSIPEMRYVFTSIRTGVEEAVFGNTDFAGLAAKMQQDAENYIKEMNQ